MSSPTNGGAPAASTPATFSRSDPASIGRGLFPHQVSDRRRGGVQTKRIGLRLPRATDPLRDRTDRRPLLRLAVFMLEHGLQRPLYPPSRGSPDGVLDPILSGDGDSREPCTI